MVNHSPRLDGVTILWLQTADKLCGKNSRNHQIFTKLWHSYGLKGVAVKCNCAGERGLENDCRLLWLTVLFRAQPWIFRSFVSQYPSTLIRVGNDVFAPPPPPPKKKRTKSFLSSLSLMLVMLLRVGKSHEPRCPQLSIAPLPGWDASPSQVPPSISLGFPDSLLEPFYSRGWRKALWEWSVLPKTSGSGVRRAYRHHITTSRLSHKAPVFVCFFFFNLSLTPFNTFSKITNQDGFFRYRIQTLSKSSTAGFLENIV